MYSFGVMLYEAFFGELKFSELGTIIIPKSENKHLTDLLKMLLDNDPHNRPSANQCLAHPYFSISSIEDAKRNKLLIESDKKIKVFQDYLTEKLKNRRSNQRINLFNLNRENVVDDMIDAFKRLNSNENILLSTKVTFYGETGIDQGGLSNEAFTLFFEQAMEKYFECEETTYIPKKGNLVELESIGRILLKCLIDQRPLVLKFPAFFYQILLDSKLDDSLSVLLQYCDQYSHSVAKGFIELLEYEGNVNDIIEDEFIKDGRRIKLNDGNKEDYIKYKIKEKLKLLDMKEYNAIRKGIFF